jgi:aspartate ammonia-lyase
MPTKVNPVIIEAVIQAGIKAIAEDKVITDCVSRSTLQINEFMPLMALSILNMINILIRADDILAVHINQIEADEKICREKLEKSPTIITAFLPQLGYDKAASLIEEYKKTKNKKSLRKFLNNRLGKKTVDKILSPLNLTSLGYRKDAKDT